MGGVICHVPGEPPQRRNREHGASILQHARHPRAVDMLGHPDGAHERLSHYPRHEPELHCKPRLDMDGHRGNRQIDAPVRSAPRVSPLRAAPAACHAVQPDSGGRMAGGGVPTASPESTGRNSRSTKTPIGARRSESSADRARRPGCTCGARCAGSETRTIHRRSAHGGRHFSCRRGIEALLIACRPTRNSRIQGIPDSREGGNPLHDDSSRSTNRSLPHFARLRPGPISGPRLRTQTSTRHHCAATMRFHFRVHSFMLSADMSM